RGAEEGVWLLVGEAGARIPLETVEVELSCLDPVTKRFELATRFTVHCDSIWQPVTRFPCPKPESPSTAASAVASPPPLTTPTLGTSNTPSMCEPSHPTLARVWRIRWRVPVWVQGPGGAGVKLSAADTHLVSSVLMAQLMVCSTPRTATGRLSVTLGAQRVRVGLLTDQAPSSSHLQPEEILRVVLTDVE
ncbi:unnamed protein product, partial [Discosporangium mesarthrocarpum]